MMQLLNMANYCFRIVFCFLLILTTKATLISLAVDSCSSDKDCSVGYHCYDSTCKKCLSCNLLFRKGGSCIADFNECGDCLKGYEEISVTFNSVVKKPCRSIQKNTKISECSTAQNPKGCPLNNYCSEGFCIKCFDCALVNRLPPANNCATGLTDCGSCKNGFHEVSVTTLMNSKPCDAGDAGKVLGSESYLMEIQVPMATVIAFVLLLIICGMFYLKNFAARTLNKSASLCKINPSAPPLHMICGEDLEAETSFRGEEIRKEDVVGFSDLSFVNEQMQQAKVFQQPNAAYYIPNDVVPSNESTTGDHAFGPDGSFRRLSRQLGINIAVAFPPSEHLDGASSRTDEASELIASDLDPREEVSNNDTGMELVEFNMNSFRTLSNCEEPDSVSPGNVAANESDSSGVDVPDEVKCRKCRHLLFLHPEITLFTAHGESYGNVSVKYVSCNTIQEDNIWFLQDNNLPQWVSESVNNSNWTKGKLNCPNCQGRLGSFDFVSGTQCQCGSHVLPPVHIVKCKVDCRNLG